MNFEKQLRTIGHSFGVIIPKAIMLALGWTEETKVNMTIENEALVIKEKKTPKLSLFARKEENV